MAFPLFPFLPAEIQLQIWESAAPSQPGMHMHVFDVRAPPPPAANRWISSSSHSRSRSRTSSSGKVRKPSASRMRKNAPAACLGQLDGRGGVSLHAFDAAETATAAGARLYAAADPSMYRFRENLRTTCADAAAAADRAQAAVPPEHRAAVELPSGKKVPYNNATDVLHLRFITTSPPQKSRSSPPPPPPPRRGADDAMDVDIDNSTAAPLSTIFRSLWSRELAAALHAARRVAIDVSQVWPELAEQQHKLVQDIVFLVCSLQNDLEVLYLVDYAAPRAARDLMAREGSLYRSLHCHGPEVWEREMQREGDVIHGVGTLWREVFDLKGLGWHQQHPAFLFGEMFSEVVRLQQGNWFGEGEKQAVFKGVRVLVAEDE